MRKALPLLIFALLVLSSSALAAVPTPGDAFRDLTTFFTGLVSGSASMENAYFISFILYFIIFIAIYMEGLRMIPIFGGKGELNKQGKWFAVAAAGLSTIAIFIVDTVTKVSTAERLSYLVSPWGVWGGVLIAAIMAYITFKFLHDSELFKEHIMFAMAIAAAVGVTLAGFLLTMENLIGWGFLLMLLVFLVGALFAIFGRSSGGGGEDSGGRDGDDGSRGPPGERGPPGPAGPPGTPGGVDEESKDMIKKILERLDAMERKFESMLNKILEELGKLPKEFHLSGEDLAKIKGMLDVSLADFKNGIEVMLKKYFDEMMEFLKEHDKDIKKGLAEIQVQIKDLGDDLKAEIAKLRQDITGIDAKISSLRTELDTLGKQLRKDHQEILDLLRLIDGKLIGKETVELLIKRIAEIKVLVQGTHQKEDQIRKIVVEIHSHCHKQEELLWKIFGMLADKGKVTPALLAAIKSDVNAINKDVGSAKIAGLAKFDRKECNTLVNLLGKASRDAKEEAGMRALVKKLIGWFRTVLPQKKVILSKVYKDAVTIAARETAYESMKKNLALLEKLLK